MGNAGEQLTTSSKSKSKLSKEKARPRDPPTQASSLSGLVRSHEEELRGIEQRQGELIQQMKKKNRKGYYDEGRELELRVKETMARREEIEARLTLLRRHERELEYIMKADSTQLRNMVQTLSAKDSPLAQIKRTPTREKSVREPEQEESARPRREKEDVRPFSLSRPPVSKTQLRAVIGSEQGGQFSDMFESAIKSEGFKKEALRQEQVPAQDETQREDRPRAEQFQTFNPTNRRKSKRKAIPQEQFYDGEQIEFPPSSHVTIDQRFRQAESVILKNERKKVPHRAVTEESAQRSVSSHLKSKEFWEEPSGVQESLRNYGLQQLGKKASQGRPRKEEESSCLTDGRRRPEPGRERFAKLQLFLHSQQGRM